MNYCALEDAYQEIGGAPTPGCSSDYATKMARKEERRKARRCKGPAATYLDIYDESTNPVEDKKLSQNNVSGLKEHVPVTHSIESFKQPHHAKKLPENEYPPTDPKYDKSDSLYEYSINESSSHIMTIPTTTDIQKKKFFGASADDEFADYIPDQENYRLQPDFLTAFEQSGVSRAGSSAKLGNPSVNMFWKPNKNGAQTSFVEHLPPPGGKFHRDTMHMQTDEIMKRIDKIFARLDDMNTPSPEHITSELLMFISSGIFVLFMLDLLVKKGSTLRF
jgi:hypothetical protein